MELDNELQEAAYNSPLGKRQTFIYENVSRETELKTATFTFPEMDGAFVQSLGLGGRTFPMKCFFTGAKCRKEADSFEKLLCERGHGVLEHPVYGKIKVVPTGKIKRVDNLVDGLNEASVEVTFSETIVDSDNSVSSIESIDRLNEAMNEFEDSARANFSDKIKTDSVEDKLQLQKVLKKQTDSVFKGVKKMASTDPKKKKDNLKWLKDAKSFLIGLENDIDKLATYAEEIASVIIKTARLPSEIAMNTLAKIEGYASIIRDIANNVKADPFGFNAVANQYAATELVFGSMLASLGFGLAVTADEADENEDTGNTGSFTSRAEVLEVSEQVANLFNAYSVYVDSQNKKNAFVDTGETYEKILNIVTLSLKVLEEMAFNLPVMRIITLDRDRQIFELLAELYGADGFNKQDEFINDNKLTADEIVLIPMGREVRYYV